MKLAIEVAAKTDVGFVRKNNEDCFGFDQNESVFLVCDGMGGHASGEVASSMAVEAVLDAFTRDRQRAESTVVGVSFGQVSPFANRLGHAIQEANRLIRQAAEAKPELAGMGSTIVAVAVQENEFAIGSVGDSRAYLIRGDAVQLLTSDHSLIMEQVRRGLLTAEEAEASTLKNVITRALGAEETVEPDLVEHRFMIKDVVLLCSDGLSRYVAEPDIARAVHDNRNLDRACEGLIEMAKKGGSDDNITCLLLRVVQDSWLANLTSHRKRLVSSHAGRAAQPFH